MIGSPAPRISVLYFAALRERVGTSSEEIELPAEVVNVRALSAWLEEHRPALKGCLGAVRFAVDEELVSPDRVLRPGDTVALLPPVSGG